MWLKVTAIAIVVVVVGLIVLGIQQRQRQHEQGLETRLTTYCIAEPHHAFDCGQWAHLEMIRDSERPTLDACDAQSPTLDKTFRDCLAGEGITP